MMRRIEACVGIHVCRQCETRHPGGRRYRADADRQWLKLKIQPVVNQDRLRIECRGVLDLNFHLRSYVTDPCSPSRRCCPGRLLIYFVAILTCLKRMRFPRFPVRLNCVLFAEFLTIVHQSREIFHRSLLIYVCRVLAHANTGF